MTSVTCLNLLEPSQLTQGDHRPENGQRISQQVKFKFGQCHSATKDFLISSGKAAPLYLHYSATLSSRQRLAASERTTRYFLRLGHIAWRRLGLRNTTLFLSFSQVVFSDSVLLSEPRKHDFEGAADVPLP